MIIIGTTKHVLSCNELQGTVYYTYSFLVFHVIIIIITLPKTKVLLFAYSGFALITMFIYTFLSSKVEAVPKYGYFPSSILFSLMLLQKTILSNWFLISSESHQPQE